MRMIHRLSLLVCPRIRKSFLESVQIGNEDSFAFGLVLIAQAATWRKQPRKDWL